MQTSPSKRYFPLRILNPVFFIGILLIMTFSNSIAQGFLHASGKLILDGNNQSVVLRGIGLGGYMMHEGYMLNAELCTHTGIGNTVEELIGREAKEEFYEAWLNNHLTKRDVDSIKAWGFNSIRLPFHYKYFTLPVEEEMTPGKNTWKQEGFQRVDQVLEWCAANEIYLILDLHAAPGGQGKDRCISDYDPNKPSLWESDKNKEKTIALWGKLAERYADEPWIGGYDLINEVNWPLGEQNAALAELYKKITEAIRAVDENHIIFIEGNSFATDFNGLTPPWDNNMVYSFHKYWNYNTQDEIQKYLELRKKYNVPLWMGETGENSNHWLAECLSLLEHHNIGWSVWTLKKVHKTANPYRIREPEGYDQLKAYWKGADIKPEPQFARDVLFQLAENMNSENCIYYKDFIFSISGLLNTSKTKSYAENVVPGIIQAEDYQMGKNLTAYFDLDAATYWTSSGVKKKWNHGGVYRNDGVDIFQNTEGMVDAESYFVGKIENGEYLTYNIKTSDPGKYQPKVYYQSEGESVFSVIVNDTLVVDHVKFEPTTGDGWEERIIPAFNIQQSHSEIMIIFTGVAGLNIDRFEFLKTD